MVHNRHLAGACSAGGLAAQMPGPISGWSIMFRYQRCDESILEIHLGLIFTRRAIKRLVRGLPEFDKQGAVFCND